MEHIIESIRNILHENIDPKVLVDGQRYFKEDVKSLGIKVPVVTKIAKNAFKEVKDLSKEEIVGICSKFWESGYIEEAFIACEWSNLIQDRYGEADFSIFEEWIRKYVSNWATCDTLCNHTVGDFVMAYPVFVEQLKRFAKSENRWMRRAAAVTLIIPARKGLFLADIFEIASILLLDKDDLVQKGYGWMLKAASEAHQQEVFQFVLEHKSVMPRTSLRYAIEKMPKELKAEAMAK